MKQMRVQNERELNKLQDNRSGKREDQKKFEILMSEKEDLHRELDLKDKELALERKKNAELKKKLHLQDEKLNRLKQAPLQ